MDWNNVAPSVGVVWRANTGSGWLSKLLSPDPVLRGGYRSPTTGKVWRRSRPSSRSNRARHAPGPGDRPGQPRHRRIARAVQPARPASGRRPRRSCGLPFTPAVSEVLNAYYPDFPTGYTHQYSVGFQRELGRNMALEIRYVGNMNDGGTDFQGTSTARRTGTSSRTGSTKSSRWRSRTCGRTSLPGAAARSPTPARRGPPRCRSSGLLRRNAAQQRREPEPGGLPRAQLHRLVVVRLAPHLQPGRNDDRRHRNERPAEFVPTPTPSRPGCLRTSSRSTPT